MADNNIEWTSEQMIEKANSWSLAGDVALLNRLKKFSEFVLSETLSISENVDNLLNNLENVSLKLELTKNEFQSLRNTQFIENRVYEDDESLENEENKKEEKELTEQEKDNVIKESIVKGLKVMEQYFEKIEVAVSDSEEENEKSYVLQPKDPYANRPLPYLVGSQEWYKKWHVGLLLSESESESEKEEEVYSSSDSEEGLPKDRNLGSETSSELDFTNRQAPPVANSTFNDSQDRRREIFHSSDDDSSDQSHSLPVKPPISNEKFAEQLAAKLGDVISATSDNVPQVNRNPIKKMNQAGQYGNLFSDEPPPLDDLQDTVLPKSAHEGPFSGGRDLFGDSTEDNLFWDQPNKTSQIVKNPEGKTALFGHADVKPNLKVSKGLFDDSDSSSEDDMFTKVEKRKTKITQPYLQPFKTTMPFLDDQPPEISSKSDTVPSKKKPIGGVSIFGENSNIFSDNSLKPGFESDKTAASTQITEDVESKPAKTPKKSKQKISLFDESSDEDLIKPKEINVTKSPERQQTVKKLSLFDDTDDILGSEKEPIIRSEHDKKNIGLFDENPYQNVDSFRPTTKEITDKTESLNKTGDVESKKPAKKVSLFDEDDDFLKEEEDIFASVPKKKGTFSDSSVKPEKTRDTNPQKKIKGLFDDLETEDSSETLSGSSERKDNIKKIVYEDSERSSEEKPAKGLTKTLFDDLETSGSSEDLFGGSKTRDTKQKEGYNKKDLTGNLFGDTESFTGRINLLEEPKMDGMNVKSVEKVVNLLGDEKERKEQPLEDKNSGGSVQGSIFDKTDNDYFEDSSIKSTDSSDIVKVIDLKDDDLIVRTNQEVEKDVLGSFKAAGAIDNVKNQEDGVPNSSKKYISDQPDDILKQNKSNLVGKIRKNVSFLDSGSESSSDDDFSFGKKNKEEKQEDSVLHGTRTAVNASDDFMKSTVSKPEELNISGLERQDVNNTETSSKLSTEKLGNTMNASPPELDETPDSNVSKVFATPPPIDLFDPNPPPLDWDAASDNSGESDTLSLTDGILSRTSLNQSQARSSLFDEAPPSLDANDSSGIVRDLNVTRVESIDSSFNPHASSSRRLSSDVFGEEQSQDSLFITKNQTESSAQHGSRLQQIPENVERSSKIENITPSGNWEDFKDSSIFTTSEIESGDSRNMDAPTSASEIKKTGESSPEDKAEDIQSVDISSHKLLDNVKNRVNVFEEPRGLDREKSVEKDETSATSCRSPIKTSPGKLQHNLKINVGALLPGAARPKILVAKSTSSDEIDKSDRFSPPVGEANSSPPLISRVTLSKSENIHKLSKEEAIADNKNFENLSQTEVLQSATKDRVRIPIKRKPSTRRARQEAVRKSMTDFTLYQNEENPSLEYEQSLENKISQSLTGINVQSENGNRSQGPVSNERNVSVKRSEEKPEIKGISFRKQEETTEKAKSPDSADLFGSFAGDTTFNKPPSPGILKTEDKTKLFGSPSADLQPSQILQSEITTPSPPKTLEKKDREPEAKSIFEDSFEDNLDLFKNTSKLGDSSGKPRNDKSLFGDDGSNSSDEDLFSTTKKAFKKDLILSTDKPLKVEEFSSRKDTKRVFSDSEGDGELFGDQSKVSAAKTGRKIIGESSKKASIFNDSDDSSEEDLFGSKTSKSGDFSRETVSIIGSKPVETKNVRIAGIKKLENKEVTDSDPLSALK